MRPPCLPHGIAPDPALAARAGTALPDTAPGILVGVAVNQRQCEGTDAAAADLITNQVNQISAENALTFQPTPPASDRHTFEAAEQAVQFGVDPHVQVVGQSFVCLFQTVAAK